MYIVRGIEIVKNSGNKYIKVIVQANYTDIYKQIQKKANFTITREIIMDYATGHFGIPVEEIVWPHHIEVKDID